MMSNDAGATCLLPLLPAASAACCLCLPVGARHHSPWSRAQRAEVRPPRASLGRETMACPQVWVSVVCMFSVCVSSVCVL